MRSATTLALALSLVLGATPLAQREGRKVSGTIISVKSRQPVAGARVYYDEGDLPTRTTTTDDKGYFEFSRGDLGVVTVVADRFATARRRWPPVDGHQLRILLDSPAVLQGTVADATSGRLVEAAITVIVEDRGGIVSMNTDTASGSFKMNDLPKGPAILIADAKGFAPFWSEMTVSAGESRNIRIRLQLEANVTGTVLDAGGSPVHGAYVVASYSDQAGAYGLLESSAGGQPWTDSNGFFALSRLIPDVPIALQAELDNGTLSNIVSVTVLPGMVQENVVLRLP